MILIENVEVFGWEAARWRGAGSLCRYNAIGSDSSRCSHCTMLHGENVMRMKNESFACKGYQRATREDSNG